MTVQVEEKPDVTYSDVGGCKEQIEKLREVVETPLLHVSLTSAPGPPPLPGLRERTDFYCSVPRPEPRFC